jgi:hypothetical protein
MLPCPAGRRCGRAHRLSRRNDRTALIWATVVTDAPDVIAVHSGNVYVAVPYPEAGHAACDRCRIRSWSLGDWPEVAALPALPGVRGRRLGS